MTSLPRPRAVLHERARDDGGFATIQFVAATALSLVLFVLVANVVVVQYARAGMRAAATEGASAGSRATDAITAEARCVARGDAALADLLGGAMATKKVVACDVTPDRVGVQVTATIAAWLPLYPPFDVQVDAVAVREVAP